MGKIIFIALILTHLPLAALGLWGHPHATCGSAADSKSPSTGRDWNYCVYRYPDSSHKVLYYFHGIMGNQQSWEGEGSEKTILDQIRKNGKHPPIVVSVSFGSSWFLAEKNSSKDSGLFELLNDEVLPFIQNKHLNFVVEENLLYGISMGGFNASQMYFKKPGFFARAALICGAMAIVSPHAPKSEIDDYIKRTGADPWRVNLALSLARNFFPTEADWEKHSPLALASALLSPFSIPIYMSNGLKDEYGFHEGNLAFVDIANLNGAPMVSTFNAKGRHCQVDRRAIADFLIP